MALDGGAIRIPIAGSLVNEVITIPVTELPEDVDTLLDALKAESAPLSLYLECALAYLSQASPIYFHDYVVWGADPAGGLERKEGEKRIHTRMQAAWKQRS